MATYHWVVDDEDDDDLRDFLDDNETFAICVDED